MQVNKIQNSQIIITRILFLIILSSMFLYVYFINSISFSTADRQNTFEMISVRQSEIGDLENKLISDTRKINIQMASAMGLSKSVVNEAIVIVRESSNRLTLNE